ncbi:hypothetical protein, partial [Clostridium sp. KO2]
VMGLTSSGIKLQSFTPSLYKLKNVYNYFDFNLEKTYILNTVPKILIHPDIIKTKSFVFFHAIAETIPIHIIIINKIETIILISLLFIFLLCITVSFH